MNRYDHMAVALLADKDELYKISLGMKLLKDGGKSRHPELRDISSWGELEEWVKDHSEGAGELESYSS